MKTAASCLLALYAALSVIDTVAAGSGRKRWSKVLLMPVLTLFCLVSGRAFGSEFSFLLLLGQLCGWLGDVLLLKKGDAFFAGGLGAFLLGHILYAGLFLLRTGDAAPLLAVITAAVIYAVILIAVAIRFVPVSPKRLKIPVVCYMAAILFMSFTACLYMTMHPAYGVLSFLGSAAFVISDTLLYIGVLKGRSDGAAVMGTYTAAQLLIALGILL